MPSGAMNPSLFRDNIFGLDKSPTGKYVEELKAQALFESNPILQQARQMDMEEQKLAEEQGMMLLGQILQQLQPQAKISELPEELKWNPGLGSPDMPHDPSQDIESFPDIPLDPSADIETFPDQPHDPKTDIETVPDELPDVVKDKGFVTSGTDDLAEQAVREGVSKEDFIKAQGKPLFHGTDSEFDSFSERKMGMRDSGEGGMLGDGFYATGQKGYAKTYGKNVKEVYFDLKNPLVIEDAYMFGGINPDKIRIKLGLDIKAKASEVRKELKKQGYDGIIINEITDSGIRKNREVVALDKSQIKTKADLTQSYDKAQGAGKDSKK